MEHFALLLAQCTQKSHRGLREGDRAHLWDDILADFYLVHDDKSTKITAGSDLKDLVQGLLTVKEFYKKIQDTARKASVDTSVQAFIFQQGLSRKIMARVDIKKWNRLSSNNLDRMFSVAEQAEKHLLEISTHNKSKKNANVRHVFEGSDNDCPTKAVKVVGGGNRVNLPIPRTQRPPRQRPTRLQSLSSSMESLFVFLQVVPNTG